MVRWVCHRRVLAGETGEDGLSCFEGILSGLVVRDGGGGFVTFGDRMVGLFVDGERIVMRWVCHCRMLVGEAY